MYLRELRLAQMERLMVEFLHGVDIYLSLNRDSNETNPKVREIYSFSRTDVWLLSTRNGLSHGIFWVISAAYKITSKETWK